jgi:hydrogenase expression/formation protein HypC
MRVIETKGGSDSLLDPKIAIVETDGMQKQIRLDLVDRQPDVGDYLIIHAGFAINCLNAKDAEENLALMREMAAGMKDIPDGEPS